MGSLGDLIIRIVPVGDINAQLAHMEKLKAAQAAQQGVMAVRGPNGPEYYATYKSRFLQR